MIPFPPLGSFEVILADTVALGAVALIGYLFGSRTRNQSGKPTDAQLAGELSRAMRIARELQNIAGRIREEVSEHQATINHFQSRLNYLDKTDHNESWQALSDEADLLLNPTMKLASNLSLAYDELRKHSNQLTLFAGSRTDRETGLRNRRAMEEQLDILLAIYLQNSRRFAAAIFSIQSEHGEVGKKSLSEFASLLEHTARDTDIVARYSSDEFVVLMPHTSLAGAIVFSQRLLKSVSSSSSLILYGGIVEVRTEDTAEKILSRADSALYSARSDGKSCLYQHTGKSIRPHELTPSSKLTEPDESHPLDQSTAQHQTALAAL
ncbi:GGDEF domain-containing protein [Bythopirellula polymerisocia]|uniref:diguanylate cyclase n=1 Tax=Bythopirellula polymerisocia TaxID=2528003 RepID=A0A5C6CV32_9BACT|nr:GGDEF domain-containing protein [Bythopirellula polymerisocia]TWU27367.1 Response regulator PleD [Bythopirellula polymerisocia]